MFSWLKPLLCIYSTAPCRAVAWAGYHKWSSTPILVASPRSALPARLNIFFFRGVVEEEKTSFLRQVQGRSHNRNKHSLTGIAHCARTRRCNGEEAEKNVLADGGNQLASIFPMAMCGTGIHEINRISPKLAASKWMCGVL
jgi:hypothetical protein